MLITLRALRVKGTWVARVGGRLTLLPGTTFLHINGPKKAETDSRGIGLCYIVQPGRLN